MKTSPMTRFSNIRDYGLIGDGRSSALISSSGSLDWLCWPRFDSPSLFAAILDPECGGRWTVTPEGCSGGRQEYEKNTNVLTTFFSEKGTEVRLTDFMPALSEQRKKEQFLPAHQVVRIVECLSNEARIHCHFEPRPHYGLETIALRPKGRLGWRGETQFGLLTLQTNRPEGIYSSFLLKKGQKAFFSLSLSDRYPALLPPMEEGWFLELLEETRSWWRTWIAQCPYRGDYQNEVWRSALALKLLCFAPSGAVIASPTTSLPEWPEADLNWDYRFCWLRDASLTTQALLSLGFREEAEAFVSWLLHTTRLTRPALKILYDVYGGWPTREKELKHLSGHKHAKPVRIGNAAAGQLQLDVYGEVINSVFELLGRDQKMDTEIQEMLNDLGQFILAHWQEPDSGIWESRGEKCHYTHSLVLSWTALDRLLSFEKKGLLKLHKKKRVEETKNTIKRLVEEKSWDETKQSYVSSWENRQIDASLLLLPWYGFLEYGCNRIKKTYERIEKELSVNTAFFYRNRDYREGTFDVCTLWAVNFLANNPETFSKAQDIFKRFLSQASPLGLFAEELEPRTCEQLGNYPLAFTHLGVIHAALALDINKNKQKEKS